MPEFQCAVAARQRDEPMFATASLVRRWLLIEVRGSWGSDAVASTDLARYATTEWRRRMRTLGVRVVAIRRDLDRGEDCPVRMLYVESGSGGRRGTSWRRDVAGLHDAVSASATLPGLDPGASGWDPHAEPLVLVCTNGRHDSCCATFGRPLVRGLRASHHTGIVWECSHIGGDRFAGNLVVLPDGLYYGRCDPDDAAAILDAYDRGEIHLDRYRGRCTLGFLPQAAEYFVRRQLEITAVDAVVSVQAIGEENPATFRVELRRDSGHPDAVTVVVARSAVPVPTPLTCTGPGEQHVPAYKLVALRGR